LTLNLSNIRNFVAMALIPYPFVEFGLVTAIYKKSHPRLPRTAVEESIHHPPTVDYYFTADLCTVTRHFSVPKTVQQWIYILSTPVSKTTQKIIGFETSKPRAREFARKHSCDVFSTITDEGFEKSLNLVMHNSIDISAWATHKFTDAAITDFTHIDILIRAMYTMLEDIHPKIPELSETELSMCFRAYDECGIMCNLRSCKDTTDYVDFRYDVGMRTFGELQRVFTSHRYIAV
jgi:hypothetical protein